MSAKINRGLFFQHIKHCRREDDRDITLRFDIGDDGGFVKHLLADNISYFECVQDCNMYSEYTRCFYILKDDKNLVFQETPLEKPYMKWRGDPLELYRSRDDIDLWALVAKRFEREKARCAYAARLKG